MIPFSQKPRPKPQPKSPSEEGEIVAYLEDTHPELGEAFRACPELIVDNEKTVKFLGGWLNSHMGSYETIYKGILVPLQVKDAMDRTLEFESLFVFNQLDITPEIDLEDKKLHAYLKVLQACDAAGILPPRPVKSFMEDEENQLAVELLSNPELGDVAMALRQGFQGEWDFEGVLKELSERFKNVSFCLTTMTQNFDNISRNYFNRGNVLLESLILAPAEVE